MPIYEYRCGDCGLTFEELTSASGGGATVTCRACASRRVTQPARAEPAGLRGPGCAASSATHALRPRWLHKRRQGACAVRPVNSHYVRCEVTVTFHRADIYKC